jgi:preprotein translocase subunit SecG
MHTIFAILIIITSILLVLVVLAQNPKGGGLSSSFAGGAGNQIMGAKKTTDFLEKATWTLAIALISLSLLSSAIPKDNAMNSVEMKAQGQIDNAATSTPFANPTNPE